MAHCSVLQVECKKAQPKEVMLPANLAKGRAATRGLGELLMVSPGAGVLQTFRYSPYTIPATNPPPSSSSSSPSSALYTQSLLQPQLHHLLGLDHAQHQQNQLALTHLLGLANCHPLTMDDMHLSLCSDFGLEEIPNIHGAYGLPVPVGI